MEATNGYEAAVVVATSHDWATSFASLAAEKAIEVLKRANIPTFDFCGDRATISRLYTDLLALTQLGWRFRLGVFIAHGDTDQKGLLEDTKTLLFDAERAKLLRGATLLLCSCLKTGDFARRITEPDIGVATVIGHHDQLCLCPKNYFNGWVWPTQINAFREAFADAAISPLVALVERSASVPDAVRQGKMEWFKLACNYAFDEPIRHLMYLNYKRLSCWP